MTQSVDEFADAEEVNAQSSKTWDQTDPIIGNYIGFKTNIGPNASNMYNVRTDDGEITGVWGSTVLDSKMEQVPIGSRVKITYLGLEDNPKSGRSFKNYSVLAKKGETQPAPIIPPAETSIDEDIKTGEDLKLPATPFDTPKV